MTDTDLTLLPLSKVTFRFAYSQNILQGPSLTPSGYSVAGQVQPAPPGIPAQQHRRFYGRDRLEAGAGHQAHL